MTFDFARLADPEFFAQHRLAAHSDHRWFASAEEAAIGQSSYEQSLDGLWKFHYAKNLSLAPEGFEATAVDCSAWDDIPVPSHIQFQGYDRPQYTNVQYPWDGLERLVPGQIPLTYNPVASYVKYFELDRPLEPGERLAIQFDGAESAVAVWLNGVYIGYAGDSFTPSEFDITSAIADGENKLAAQVYRWTSGSWIEDQDFYRFSGLFRGVRLKRRPRAHAEDIRLEAELTDDLSQAEVRLQVKTNGTIRAHLTGVGQLTSSADKSADNPAGSVPAGSNPGENPAVLSITLDQPQLWSAEQPQLYDLTVQVFGPAGELTEHIPLHLGVRRCGIEDGVLKINGQRLVIKGVNRHEFGLDGRVMTRQTTESDIRQLKAAGVNAIRTSHYPNNSFFYELCDRYGLYVVDEMNLESHAMWDLIRWAGAPQETALPGDRPEWLPVLLDRAASMFERDKNHASVIIWSCGNESFGGRDILAVSNYFRQVDHRPVHYEGVHWDPRYLETTDIVSRMYPPAAEVEAYLVEHRDKPYILCEYAHAMGNSFGGVERYIDLAYREPLFQGGFIWDFADQAIELRDRYGQLYFGYGGDAGDVPNDADFSGNGIWFADHTPSPKLQEVRYLYQPLKIEIGQGGFSVSNRHLFTNAADYRCFVTLGRQGRPVRVEEVEVDLAPGASASFGWPFAPPTAPGEYTVDVSFQLRQPTPWAPAGHEVAYQQAVFAAQAGKLDDAANPAGGIGQSRVSRWPELIDGIHNLGVRGEHFTALFSRLQGGLVSYRFGLTSDGGRELLRSVPRPNFWHAPTSNERGWNMQARDGQWLLASRYARADGPGPHGTPEYSKTDGVVEVRYALTLPTRPPSRADLVYRVHGDGRIDVELTVRPGEGLSDMPELGMLFTAPAEFDRLRWYGEGPEESYVDRRGGARLGLYEALVAQQLTPYLRPQEAGNHTGVRWAEVTDRRGNGLRFEAGPSGPEDQLPAGWSGGMEFSALPWTPFEIENADHPNELPAIQRTVLRPALMRRGLAGDDSWGAEPHPEYRLPAGQELVFRFSLIGLRG